MGILVTNSVGDSQAFVEGTINELVIPNPTVQLAFRKKLLACLSREHLPKDIAPISIWHRCLQEVRGEAPNYPIFTQTEVLLAASQPSTLGQIGDFIENFIAPPIIGAVALVTGVAPFLAAAEEITGAPIAATVAPGPVKITAQPSIVQAQVVGQEAPIVSFAPALGLIIAAVGLVVLIVRS